MELRTYSARVCVVTGKVTVVEGRLKIVNKVIYSELILANS
jgi:hypothetical protein